MMSTNMEQPTQPSVEPQFALLFYGTSRELFATQHDLALSEKEIPVIGSGTIVNARELNAFATSLLEMSSKETELLPSNILSTTSSKCIWYVTGKVRPMFFSSGGVRAKKPINAPYPNLIFKVSEEKLFVVAYKGRGRPTAKTRLYHAPLMNINASSSVCLGNAKRAKDSLVSSIPVWEDAIFGANYTHVNHDHTINLNGKKKVTTPQHRTFWRKLSTQGVEKFPSDNLNPMGITLGEWMGV